MRIGGGVEDSDDEVRELVLVSPLVVRPPVVGLLDVCRPSSILSVDRVSRGDLLRRLPTRGRLRLGLLRPGGPSGCSGCHVRQPLCIRGLVRPTRLAASAAAGKCDRHQRRGNPAPLGLRHQTTLPRPRVWGNSPVYRRQDVARRDPGRRQGRPMARRQAPRGRAPLLSRRD